MSTTAGTSLKQWQDNWAECNRRYVAMATENESLQSQLAAANEQIRRLWPAKLSAAPCSICGYNGPGYYQAETHPCAAQKADAAAPVPSQPAVVQDAVVRALIEAAQMAVEMIETEKHERRHVRWALKDALLAAKPADTVPAQPAVVPEGLANAVLANIAAIAHCGGLAKLDNENALSNIRQLSKPWCDNTGTLRDLKNRVDAAILSATDTKEERKDE